MKASFPNEMALLPQACRVGSALRADCTDSVAAIAVAILLGMLLFIRVYTRRRLGTSLSSAEHLRDDIGMVREFLSQLETARSSFIDNRHVTEWMAQYSPVFSRLNGIPKGNLDQPIKLAVETFERLRANVDYWNSLYIQEASVNYDALFGHLSALRLHAPGSTRAPYGRHAALLLRRVPRPGEESTQRTDLSRVHGIRPHSTVPAHPAAPSTAGRLRRTVPPPRGRSRPSSSARSNPVRPVLMEFPASAGPGSQ